ncbi:MAG: phage tail protein, partial [Methanomicrobium sp.]|nr:phage tail protein [Methanomicrobium sp.]
MDILGMAATDLPDSYTLQHDIKKLDIDSGISTFEMEFLYQDDTHVKAKEIVAVGNYILRYHNDQTEFYTIIESEDDTEKKTIWVYAEDAGLDLLNEIVQPYAAASAQNIAFYINRFTRDSGFEIGLNEVSDRTRTLSWDGSATASERVRSIANQFDAEIGYRFDINKLEVKHKYIDIYERRGTDTEQELRLGREVDKIVEKKSITNLCICLRVTGGTPEGTNTPITLKGYSYDDGDIYVDNDGYGDLKSRKALEIWSRYLSEAGTGDGHIVGSYSYDTTEQATLCTYAVKELKKRSQPAINYEVSLFYLPENLKVGDNVRIVDDNGELYLSARVLATEERICDKLYRATFGDFIIKDSGISDKVRELAEQFAQTKTMYTWVAYADDEFGTNISTSPVGKKYVGIAANMAVEEVSIADPTVFSWSLIKGDTGTTFTPTVNEDGVISWVNDGGAANPDPVDLTGVVIDNLAVGGKNLLRGTKDLISGASGWSSGHWRTSGSGGTVVYNYTDPQGQTIIKNAPVSKVKGIKITATAANAQIGFCQDYAPIQAQEITQSIWVKGNVGDQIVLQPIWASAPGEEESGSKSFTLDSTKWQRLTFTKTPNHDHESVSLGYVYLYAAAANNVVYFVAPKMEYGNIATDWSPAVEDVDEGINNAAQVAESYITYVSAADGIRVHN